MGPCQAMLGSLGTIAQGPPFRGTFFQVGLTVSEKRKKKLLFKVMRELNFKEMFVCGARC